MSAQKRGRACIACASIKIKCQLGSDTTLQPPCERCVRLNKDCVLSAPKRQKDRVAELEAQVATLTRLLREQGVEAPDAGSPDTTRKGSVASERAEKSTASTASKKRRLDSVPSEGSNDELSTPVSANALFPTTSPDMSTTDTSKLDQILSRELQQRVLERYINEMAPMFPLVPVTGDRSLDAMRRERPLLLQAVLYAAGMGVLSLDVQEDIARLLLSRLTNDAIGQGEKSLELIQALQIACIWYRAPKYHRHVAIYQIIQLTSGLVMDMGVAEPYETATMGIIPKHNMESTDCWRAWLSSYCMSAAMSVVFRRENSTPWSEYLEQYLLYLPAQPGGPSTDKWLTQYFRAERMCEKIAVLLEFADYDSYHDVSEPAFKSKIQTCRNHILNWRVSIPQTLRTPLILFWEHLATAYMFEPILHTPTNKQSFAAPYVSERLSSTDFPAPVITQDHITAVYELISAAHAMIDVFVAFDAQTLIVLSGLLVSSRAAYANFLLAKLYIAATIPGNTIGSIVDPSIIRAEEYNDKLFEASKRVHAIDDRCATARILGASNRMQEWYSSYNTNLYSDDGLLNPTAGFQFDSYMPAIGVPPVANATSPTQKAADYETFFRFSDSAADFGLDILFSEPMPNLFDDSASGMSFAQFMK